MALIKHLSEMAAYLPLSMSVKVLPAFDLAESLQVVPIIGRRLYDRLQAAYDGSSLSAQEQLLIGKIRAVSAPMAYLYNLPFMQTQLTDNGIIAYEAEQSRKAFKWEYNEVKEALQDRACLAQELLIEFLQSETVTFPEWADAPYNSNGGFPIIRHGADLADAVGLVQPQRCYLLVKPLLQSVARLYIRPAIGDDYYNGLADRIVTGSLDPLEYEVLNLLRLASGRLAMKHAALEMTMRFSGNGFTIIDTVKDSFTEGQKAAGDPLLSRFIAEMEQSGNVILQQAISLLNKNASADRFAEYFFSPQYEPPEQSQPAFTKNSQRKNFYC